MVEVVWEAYVIILPVSGVRPLSLVILSSLSLPPFLIFTSRFSRRMRACLCAGLSSIADIVDGRRVFCFGGVGLPSMRWDDRAFNVRGEG
jgi:hypothetical protein